MGEKWGISEQKQWDESAVYKVNTHVIIIQVDPEIDFGKRKVKKHYQYVEHPVDTRVTGERV